MIGNSWMTVGALIGALSGWTAVRAEPPATGGDIPTKFVAPTESNDFVKREVMIAMRDGVKLFTIFIIPRGAHSAPLLLTRTPYNASGPLKITPYS